LSAVAGWEIDSKSKARATAAENKILIHKNSILQAIDVEPRLAEGMAGIEKIKKEGYFYSDEDRSDLKKIFQIMGKIA
jgi:hypothetical protein